MPVTGSSAREVRAARRSGNASAILCKNELEECRRRDFVVVLLHAWDGGWGDGED